MYKEDFEVDEIIDKKIVNGEVRYKVLWKGYSKKDSTWEPIENLENVLYMIDEFENHSKLKSDEKEKLHKTKNYNKYKIKKSVKEEESDTLSDSSIKSSSFFPSSVNDNLIDLKIRKYTKSQRKTNKKNRELSLNEDAASDEISGEGMYAKKKLIDKEDKFYKKKSKELENRKKDKKEYKNVEGNIKSDVPNAIIGIKKSETDLMIHCIVDWKQRYDGTKPVCSLVPSTYFKKNSPELLLDYYQSKLVIHSQSSPKY